MALVVRKKKFAKENFLFSLMGDTFVIAHLNTHSHLKAFLFVERYTRHSLILRRFKSTQVIEAQSFNTYQHIDHHT